MSQAPFSKPDVNNVVSSSPVFKIRRSLNHWSEGRLPKARGKRPFGLVVIALLLLCLQLTACDTTAPSTIGSASPTSNSTSQPDIPSTTSSPGPTSGSTTTSGPTTGPAPEKNSFTISVQGGTFCYTGTAGQSDVKIIDFPSPLDLLYNGSTNPAPGPINWTVSALAEGGASCSDPSPCTNPSGNWLSFNPSSGSLPYGSPPKRVTLQVSHTASMPVGVYCTKIQFNPVNSDKDYAYAELLIVAAPSGPRVSSIRPTSGSAADGIIITGTGFTDVTAVKFVSIDGTSSTAATNFNFVSDTQITAVVPPGGSGSVVDVTVTTPNGTSATGAADQFTYT